VELVRPYHGHIVFAAKDLFIVGRIAVHFFTKAQKYISVKIIINLLKSVLILALPSKSSNVSVIMVVIFA
jgi:hypothetical protein